MTAKKDFEQSEWELIAEGPVTAGMIVMTAEGGGTFRETFALSKAYVEARKQHGDSELLDEIVSAKPEFDRHRYHSTQQLHDDGLQRLADAVALVSTKATPKEVDDYKAFVVNLAAKVAAAHKEHGQQISPAEQTALDDVGGRLSSATA